MCVGVGICEIGVCGDVWLVRKVVESERKWKLLLKLELSMLFFGSLDMATKFKSESKRESGGSCHFTLIGNCCGIW